MLLYKYKIIFALIGGILMGLTPAPLQAVYLAWIALVPLWILISGQKHFNLFIPLAWGFGYYGLALFWLTGIHPMTWMGVPWLASLAITFLCWLFVTCWGTVLVIAWSAAIFFLNKYLKINTLTDILLRLLIGVTLWCCLESIWSLGPLWWSSLSYTQSPNNLIILQLSKFSGPSTVTAAIVAVNGLIAESILTDKFRKLLLSTAIVSCFGLHLIGFFLFNQPLEYPQDTAIKVGIIQGNIPNQIKLYPEGWRKAIEGYTEGYNTLASSGVDVILTPETALPFIWQEFVSSGGSFYQAILTQKVPAWVGTFGQKGYSYTNSLFTITGDGQTYSQYDKIKLVPLGEYIPFENILGSIINRLSPLDAHLAAGKPNQIFDTPFGRAIVGICYESAFAEHFRRQAALGGEFIITSSNNAHYSAAMPAQHHALDVMRAIETDRWAARATNTGYSAIVNPKGQTLWISGINTYELHADNIYRRQTQTLYVKWGDWLTILLLFLSVILSFKKTFFLVFLF